MDENKKDKDCEHCESDEHELQDEKITKKHEKAEKKAWKQKHLSEIEALKEEAAQWKNKYYMAYADTENLKKQYDAEQREIRKYRAVPFIDKLLPALDIFQAVLAQEVRDPVLKNYLTGFQYVYKQIAEALTSEGVEVLEVKVGDPFDVKTMHAIESKVTTEQPPQTVSKVYTHGYKLHERLIRAAQVEVAVREKVEHVKAEEVDEEKEKKDLN